jgi:hypothetical protein
MLGPTGSFSYALFVRILRYSKRKLALYAKAHFPVLLDLTEASLSAGRLIQRIIYPNLKDHEDEFPPELDSYRLDRL